MSRKPKDPCKANACKIQACLSGKCGRQLSTPHENHYQEAKCLDVLEQMRLCCVKWHKESYVCSGIDLERSYLTGDHSQPADKKKVAPANTL